MTAEPNTTRRAAPYHGSANPYATYVDLDAPQRPVPAAPPPPAASPPPPPPSAFPASAPPRRSRLGLTLAVAAVLLLALGGAAAAFGVNAWARSAVCTDLSEVTAGLRKAAAGPASDTPPTEAEVQRGADEAHARTRLLVLDRDLKDAYNGFFDDVQRLAALERGGATDTAALAGALRGMDAHLRAAQRACGQPVTGLPLS
ncbi:hypothetical protein [Dactylosporangium salmoneum]